MKIKVMKFGGTSLQNETMRTHAYQHIMEASKQGKVVVVVSAMGRLHDPYATDTLLSIGSNKLTSEEKAKLVSIGEQLSTLKVCSDLLELGLSAFSLDFAHSGIYTDSQYDYARVTKLDPSEIKQKLMEYDVIVVGGFIGISKDHKVTTLGRGGSDFSAVLFAHMLGLSEVAIYTDVDGVYDHDPKCHASAKRYTRLCYDEMLKLNSRVLHDRSVAYAKQHRIRIHLLGTCAKGEGTWIEE